MFLCTTGHGYSRAVTVKHQSQLEEKIKVLEDARSDLEAEVEKLERQLKQLAVLPSDIQ